MPTYSIDPLYPHWFRCDLCGWAVAEVLPAEALGVSPRERKDLVMSRRIILWVAAAHDLSRMESQSASLPCSPPPRPGAAMKTALRFLLACITISVAGCGSTTPTTKNPGKGTATKKPGGDGKLTTKRKKGKNPLVGRWVIAKAGKQDWSDKVSKDAVIEFHDEDSPGTGKLTVTDKGAGGEGYYIYEGKTGFRFEVKFRRKDGTPKGGYGGLMQISKLADNEIVGDLFTLRRVD